jgi:hypothetical protein
MSGEGRLFPATQTVEKAVKLTMITVRLSLLWLAVYTMCSSVALGQQRDSLIGIWQIDEGFQITELLFRSDGRYHLDTKSTNPELDFSDSERGEYLLNGSTLTLKPFDWFGEEASKSYVVQLVGNELTLTRTDIELTYVYRLKSGSREQVLAGESVPEVLVGKWLRRIPFAGTAEYTFRPGGFYLLKNRSEGDQFPPELIYGRYQLNGNRLTITPYSGIDANYELDFFANTLTLIKREEFSGSATIFEGVPGSEAEVRAKSAEAEALLSRENWQVGVWEIRDPFHTVDLTLRPDGHYSANEQTENLKGLVRGRYTLEGKRIHLMPFEGQGIYARSNGEFGKVERTRELDYYDGELQFIDLQSLSQSVTTARKRAGSEAPILEKARAAQEERQRANWWLGIWEVNDPAGWMEFTLRPDGRYIAKSGANGTPSEVERGEYLVRGDKLTLVPYLGQGPARGFELDLYDGELLLGGDSLRLVVARKIPNSETGVIQKTVDPVAMKGERGGILGLWTANVPEYSAELVFRPDGEFRLKRCANNVVSQDYGLYSVDMNTRTLVSDTRFATVQTLGLDFYGNTMTIYGSPAGPSTYTVNLGTVDSAIEACLAVDAAEEQVDAQWLARLPIAPRDPNAVQTPSGDLPADPLPGKIFNSPTVFSGYQLYRRLILGFVYFKEQDTIKSLSVVNTREWHFFPTGRVMVRFKNYFSGLIYPNVIEDVSISWGAYRIEPKPSQKDILHIYADNVVFIEMDSEEQAEMTLEDGRRNLFWGKDYQIQSQWATEQKAIPCEPAPNGDPSLINSGVSLKTNIKPDAIAGPAISIVRSATGALNISGTAEAGANLVIESAIALGSPTVWQPVLTNSVSAGTFNLQVPAETNKTGFYRVRVE